MIHLSLNEWETAFFGRAIYRAVLDDTLPLQASSDTSDGLQQIKLAAGEIAKADYLQQHGFHLVEGEVDFCLDLGKKNVESDRLLSASGAIRVATEQDIPALEALFGEAFPTSRFRSPYFSREENRRFYQTWIRKAVRGEFDHLCLIKQSNDGKLQGGISLRQSGESVRVGLLAVAPEYQGQGIASQLVNAAIAWAVSQHAQQFWVATQISNLPAIRLYQRCGAEIHATAYWFYRK